MTPLTRDQQTLVEDNMALVPWVLTHKLKRISSDPEWDDLMQDGAIGLCYAAARFDPALGNRFSTFAVQNIWGYAINGARDRNGTDTRANDARADFRSRQPGMKPPTPRRIPQASIVSMDRHVNVTDDHELTLADVTADPAPAFDDRVADRDLADRALRLVTPVQAEALMSAVDPLNLRELADRDGVTTQSVQNRRLRGRLTLAEIHFDHGDAA